MKTTNALMAAALAGVFAAGTTVSSAITPDGSPVAAEEEKDKDKCPGKDKEKDKCDGKDGCKGKDKDKDKEEEKGEIL